ncbi:MAG: hypothetical protein RL653_921 [Pseudomonadota bacterium]|jgi:hypothetical protein
MLTATWSKSLRWLPWASSVGLVLAFNWIPPAARAWVVLVALLGFAAWVRGRQYALDAERVPPPMVIHARHVLSRDCGLALVEADGARFLLAWGPQGARFQALAAPGLIHGGDRHG